MYRNHNLAIEYSGRIFQSVMLKVIFLQLLILKIQNLTYETFLWNENYFFTAR